MRWAATVGAPLPANTVTAPSATWTITTPTVKTAGRIAAGRMRSLRAKNAVTMTNTVANAAMKR
ncbi:hypothetical protein GALL_461890 [mine drainage metagenome]|uniref:Uncharacterized protein n=1 Tax=mine drainage metagenome TaxID=410659 RepID=A0A1J5Q3Z7_9ZZZZ